MGVHRGQYLDEFASEVVAVVPKKFVSDKHPSTGFPKSNESVWQFLLIKIRPTLTNRWSHWKGTIEINLSKLVF